MPTQAKNATSEILWKTPGSLKSRGRPTMTRQPVSSSDALSSGPVVALLLMQLS